MSGWNLIINLIIDHMNYLRNRLHRNECVRVKFNIELIM